MSDRIELRVPDIGDFRDVPVVEIAVSPGDRVDLDQPVVMLESDKATLDIPSPSAGRVLELAVAVGDRVSEGSVLMYLEPASAEASPEPAPAPEQVSALEPALASEPAPEAEHQRPGGRPTTPEPAPAAPAPTPAAEALPARPEVPDARAAAREGSPPHASPTVRKFARELGADIHAITSTGPKGRIMREDVQAHVKAALARPQAPSAAPGLGLDLPDWPRVDHARFGPIERQPLSRIKRISGPALTRNALVIPHVTNFDKADVTELEAFRQRVNAAGEGPKLTLLAFAVKAAVAALKRYPLFNSSLGDGEVVLKQYYNIGVAADTPEGLVVPVVKEADRKGITEIAAEMARLAAEARAGRLKPSDMQGATFTISSLGGVGGTGFTPIINAPEVAILGLVRATTEPVWDGSAFLPRLIQPLSLSWDHRVVDGVAAARFLLHIKDSLSDHGRLGL